MTNTRSLMSSTALSGALAVSALVVAAGAAQAATATFGNATGGTNITLATQSLNASGAVGLSQANQTIIITPVGAETCSTGGQITITAPSGVLFASVPNVSFTGANAACLTASGVVNSGSSSVTYTLTSISAATFNSVSNMVVGVNGSTGPISLTTGSTFTSPVTTARTFTVSGVACATTITTATTANGLLSASGFGFTASANGGAVSVDTTATGAGRLFVTSATASTRVATLGSFTVNAVTGVVDASSGAAYTLPANSAVTLTATGPFAAASRVYVGTSTCVTTAGAALPSGYVTGTISGATATFSALATSSYNLCYENNSTSVIQAGTTATPAPVTATASISTLTGSTSAVTIGLLQFSGNATSLNYVTGGSAYQYFVRVTNPNTATTSVFAVVTRDDGQAFSGSVTTNLGANANALYSITDLNTATGANLSASDRARIQILTSAATAPVSGLLFNTATGVVTTSN